MSDTYTKIWGFLGLVSLIGIGFIAWQQKDEQTFVPSEAMSGTVVIEVPDASGSGIDKGTGFFIDDNTIVTNDHVVSRDLPTKIYVLAKDNPKIYEATLIATDPLADVALIKIDDWKGYIKENPYHIFKFSKNMNVSLGDKVYLFGNPETFNWTLTQGIVSGIDQHLDLTPESSLMPNLQVDARLLHGNSGGPITDDQGRVIGISDKLFPAKGGFPNPVDWPDAAGGVGLGIPVDIVTKSINDLLDKGKVQWPTLGMRAVHKDKNSVHFIVDSFTDDSVVKNAGVQVNDIIMGIKTKNTDGYLPIQEFDRLRDELFSLKEGDNFALTVNRAGKDITYDIKLTNTKTSEDLVSALTEADAPKK